MGKLVLILSLRHGYGAQQREVKDRQLEGLRQRKGVVEDIPEDDGSETAQVNQYQN